MYVTRRHSPGTQDLRTRVKNHTRRNSERIIKLVFITKNNITPLFFCCGAATQRGSWPLHSWGSKITHNDAPQSVGLLWTSDQLVAETSAWQHTTLQTNIHAPGGIRTHDLSRRAVADLRLRPRGT